MTDAAPVLKGRRILLVVESLVLGGAERQAVILARELMRRYGASCEVRALHREGPAAALCDRHGVPWAAEGMAWTGRLPTRLVRMLRLARSLREARPEVLLSFTMLPNVVCGLIWRRTGARLFVWNQRDEGRGRQRRFLESRAVRRTPLFLSNSLHGARFLVETLGAPARSVHAIPNGVELEAPRESPEAWRRRLSIPGGAFVACMPAHLHRFKDHATLVEAWRIVAERLGGEGRAAVLVLAGRHGETHAALGEQVRRLGLEERVLMPGEIDDVSGLLSCAHAGVFSSRFEGVPNGALECLAAGLPVVGTDSPGVREALGPLSGDLLVPCGDAGALAGALTSLAHDEERRVRLGREAAAWVREAHGPERLGRSVAGHLVRALAGTRG